MNRKSVQELYIKEPELRRIVERAAEYRNAPFSEKNRYYIIAKREADQFVGYGARNEELCNDRSWVIFHAALTEAMRF